MKIRLAAIIALVLAIASASRAQTDAEQVTNIGRNVLSMEDYLLSIQYFNQAIKAKPYLPDPYFYRAVAKLSLEDYAGAEADCTLALERNRYKTESYKVRGFARQHLGKDSLAVEDYEQGLRYNPQDKYFLFYKAVAETELKRFSDADSTFSLLVRYYPGFADGLTARARLRAIEGDTVRALEDAGKAIGISATSVQPYLVRADIKTKQGEWKEALADMDAVLRLMPHESDYYLNRAYVRYNLDDYFGAMADYNYAIELSPANTSALFNRALLRFEVNDLRRAAADFEKVLELEPGNFHALYNLGLVNAERGRYTEAVKDYDAVAARYPRFYPVYYARSEAKMKSGDTRGAVKDYNHAQGLLKAYVRDPGKNALDRPAVAQGKANDGRGEESEEEVMERFNQLVVSGSASRTELTYNDKIKGRLQDNENMIELEPCYLVGPELAHGHGDVNAPYFKELEEFNALPNVISHLLMMPGGQLGAAEYGEVFALADKLNSLTGLPGATAADWLVLGASRGVLKDFEGAEVAFSRAADMYPGFTLALFGRGYVRQASGDPKRIAGALADYDSALKQNPQLAAAWFNKGALYGMQGDWVSALSCYNEALRIDPHFGAALFNRGITYLRLGNKKAAFADLSAAGQYGIAGSYSILKRMR